MLTGNVTGTVELPRLLGADYPATVGILRQSVHEVLADELMRLAVPIRLGTTVATLAQDDGGVDVEFSDGTRGALRSRGRRRRRELHDPRSSSSARGTGRATPAR